MPDAPWPSFVAAFSKHCFVTRSDSVRYTQFVIKNFKGIQKLTFELPAKGASPIITLVGLNESGKTTILEAINSFTYGTDDLKALDLYGYSEPDPHDMIPIAARANFNGSVVICAHVTLDQADETALRKHLRDEHDFALSECTTSFTVEDVYPFTASRYDQSDFKRRWSFILSGTIGRQRKPRDIRARNPIWLSAVKFLGARMPRIWYFPNFLFEFPSKIYLEASDDLPALVRERHAFYRRLLQDIIHSIDSTATIEKHILDRARSDDQNDRRSLAGLLLEMGRAVTQTIFGAWNKIFHRAVSNKRILIANGTDEEGRHFLSFQIEDNDGYYSISERSLGFRWFFVYLLITSYRTRAHRHHGAMLLLLDEPASNLHSRAQEQLLRSFGELVDRCVVLYTTHSSHMINPHWLESTYIVQNKAVDYSEINDLEYNARCTDIAIKKYRTFVGAHPTQTTYFQPILDVLEYAPPVVGMGGKSVIVEGKTDYYLLKYLMEITKTTELALIPGGGAGSATPLLSLYIGWGRPFVVLLDGDKEGQRQKRNYVDAFGESIAEHIALLSDIKGFRTGQCIEACLDADDGMKIINTVFPNRRVYDKKMLHRVIPELLATNEYVDICSETRDNCKAIVSHLDELFKNRE